MDLDVPGWKLLLLGEMTLCALVSTEKITCKGCHMSPMMRSSMHRICYLYACVYRQMQPGLARELVQALCIECKVPTISHIMDFHYISLNSHHPASLLALICDERTHLAHRAALPLHCIEVGCRFPRTTPYPLHHGLQHPIRRPPSDDHRTTRQGILR